MMCGGTLAFEFDFVESFDEEPSDEANHPPDTGAEDTGTEDKEPETSGLGLKTLGLGAGSVV